MGHRRIVIDVPEQVLLVEKTDEASFAREICRLAAVKLYELGRLSSGRAARSLGGVATRNGVRTRNLPSC